MKSNEVERVRSTVGDSIVEVELMADEPTDVETMDADADGLEEETIMENAQAKSSERRIATPDRPLAVKRVAVGVIVTWVLSVNSSPATCSLKRCSIQLII